jgi:hypothetical protein
MSLIAGGIRQRFDSHGQIQEDDSDSARGDNIDRVLRRPVAQGEALGIGEQQYSRSNSDPTFTNEPAGLRYDYPDNRHHDLPYF